MKIKACGQGRRTDYAVELLLQVGLNVKKASPYKHNHTDTAGCYWLLVSRRLSFVHAFDPLPGEPVRFAIRVYDDDGDEVGSGTITFNDAGVQQHSLSNFGVEMLLDGYVEFDCLDPTVTFYAYASRVDQVSGDAVFRQARGRQSDLP